ncbi:DUF4231 domain-containing protein [Allocoleopsis franciscana]|uniref:DUF4231 domain-containing protein n=1 Tax=Allocoleopsis franciscana PCC 7113 TaxID=1173027 RepID=K9WA36_9CYAN|nr:DUF4231 domain-containing protein [Allocoleopsis franciscana]AFZ17255.1 hypothetical protein Mic7113_1371 [Allocoleopsis franciscana PCC 7113]
MAKKNTYNDYLKQEMSELIEEIELPSLQKRFMKSRWLDQVLWLEGRATKSRSRHNSLRLITIIGGVLVPAVVSANSGNISQQNLKHLLGWTAFGLSQAVAISAAVEEFFHFGENYRRYRNTAENMKIQGWQFFQLTGPYKDAKNHSEAYPTFASNVENIIQQDVEGYISQAVESDTEIKAATQAVMAQNIALANIRLSEHLQPPPSATNTELSPHSTAQTHQPSPPVVLLKEDKVELVTSDSIPHTQLESNNNLDNKDSSIPSLSPPLVANSSPGVEPK